MLRAAQFPAARAAAASAGVAATQLRGVAEALPLRDGVADGVLMTHTLCSVRSPRAALAEASRVLRPGGLFIFLDHEAARSAATPHSAPGAQQQQQRRTGWLPPRLAQRLFEGPWRLVTGGCHLTRHTGDVVAAATAEGKLFDAASFQMERFQLPPDAACFPGMWLMAPHVAGVAVKPGGAAAAAERVAAAGEAAEARAAAAQEEEKGARVPLAGRPEERFARAEAHIAEEEAGKKDAAAKEEEAGGVGGVGGMARAAAETAAVALAAAATVTAASAPALLRRARREHAD
jgi:SAM-dependent methyltransferase